jgi:DNA-binding SARP family transcriptional activator
LERAAIEFRVLGPLEVSRGGRALTIAGKPAALLALLLVHANEVVSTDRLIDGLWGNTPPKSAAKLVQGYISHLRRLLTIGSNEEGGDGGPLLTRPSGYILRLEQGQVDADRFRTLFDQARAALADGGAEVAVQILGDALDLWRGPPFADFAYQPFAQDEIARLEELRLIALEEQVEASLALGRHAPLVGELEALIAHHPLRERLRAQLMVALYRCDRQSEALRAYQDARRLLVEELGLEPSRRLRDLEQAVLRQDPALDWSPRPRAVPGAADPGQQVSRDGVGSVFVGREQELEALRRALGDALAGHGRLLVIGGEPGIGKSRLVDELARSATGSGAEVVWGRCWEAGGAPPYWPWVQAIRSYAHGADPGRLRRELGANAAEIGEVVADLREQISDLGTPPAIDDPQMARFRLFDGITSFLKRASGTQPLVVVLDDLHWADEGSLRLLEFVAREVADARLLLVGTYRDVELSRRHPLSRTLAELNRERLFERIVLRGLNSQDVSEFIEATWDVSPPPSLVGAVHSQTEGNPFFVTEVVRLLAQEGEFTPERLSGRESWTIRIPEGVREVIGRRLDLLSDECNEALAVASVIGREFGLDQLQRLLEDYSENRLVQRLDEALSARVIEEATGAVDRYQFTHSLIQETLADELSLTRRVRLHARIAEALEALYGDDVDRHAGELAHHFGQAQTLLGAGKFVHYSLVAGEAALAASAHEQALAHFDRALAATEGGEIDDETAALHFGRGRALLAVLPRYELEQASNSLRRAFDYYEQVGDLGRAVTVAACPISGSLGLGATDFPELIARALKVVPADSHGAGQLLAQYGWYCGIVEADYGEAVRAFERALSLAQTHGDGALERRTLAHAAWVGVWHFRRQECLEKGLRAIELARLAGDDLTEINARRSIIWALMATGELEQIRAHTAAELALAERVRDQWSIASAGFDNARLAVYEGEWETVRRMSDIGAMAEPRGPRALAMRALLEYELGNFDAGEKYIARLHDAAVGTPPGPIAEHVFMVGVTALAERIAKSDERLASTAASAEAILSLPHIAPALAMVARSARGLIAVQRGEAEVAETHYRVIEPEQRTACFIIPLTFDRLLALLAVTFGQIETALGHFEDGLVFCERAGYRPEYAWTACDYAEALLLRDRPGDGERAAALQQTALGIAGKLEMRPLIERILARQKASAARRPGQRQPGAAAETVEPRPS